MLVVTLLSLVIAAISSVIAWRNYRFERMRSAARVAALGAALDPPQDDGFRWPPADHMPFDRTGTGASVEPPYFDASTRDARARGPLVTAAVSVVAGVVMIVVMAMLADRDRSVPAAETPAPSPLELLAMTQTRDGAALLVSGVVRNAARTGTAPVTTVVTAFDRDGQTIASATTALSPLGPGTTRPFSVRMENAASVNRYRVSFRTEVGVLPHVDRRGSRVGSGTVAE
jgi:hypothetical protein